MTRLTHLKLDVDKCDSVDKQELASLLLELCRPHPGAQQLKRLECGGVSSWRPRWASSSIHSDEVWACKWSVLQQLERKYGVKGVEIRM